MTEYNEGDLVEGVKGESVIRGRLDNIGNMIIDGLDWRVASLIRNGFAITVVEKAAPVVVLPTEPGLYSAHDYPIEGYYGPYRLSTAGKWYEVGSGYCSTATMAAVGTLTRLEPVSETAKKVIDTILSRRDMGHTISRTLGEIAKEFGVEL